MPLFYLICLPIYALLLGEISVSVQRRSTIVVLLSVLLAGWVPVID